MQRDKKSNGLKEVFDGVERNKIKDLTIKICNKEASYWKWERIYSVVLIHTYIIKSLSLVIKI